MKKEHSHLNTHFSIFDSIEQVTLATQHFLSSCEKKVSKPLTKIFHQWERALSSILTDRQSKDQELSDLKEKYSAIKTTELKLRVKLTHKKSKETEMIQEIQAIKDHLEEGKEMWARQIKRIEEVMQEQERSKQKLESLYRQRLSEIDKELDDIMHIHKKKLEASQDLAEILPGLFSMEELLEEKRIALGEISKRELREVKIVKLEGGSEEDVCESEAEPEMNFEDLSGTQKLVFERLLQLRKKVYKFKHDDTTCSEGSSDMSLPLELKSMSLANLKKVEKKLSKTVEKEKKEDKSVVFCRSAGIVFGLWGSQKYRNGLAALLNSDKLSISAREKIVYDLIHTELTGKVKTVTNEEITQEKLFKPEELPTDNWTEVSSIHKSQDLQHMFSKVSLDLSKVVIEKEGEATLQATESITEFQDLFNQEHENKDQEMSSMSILKDFSRITNSTKHKINESSKKEFDLESIASSRRKFSIDQREPNGNLIIPPNLNFFVPEPSRPKSNPRVTLKSENREFCIEDSICSSNKTRITSETVKKPISIIKKIPILPKPPNEAKKLQVKNFRGRSLQPVQPKASSASPARKITSNGQSTSPSIALNFRMKRFKDPNAPETKPKPSTTKNLLPKRARK